MKKKKGAGSKAASAERRLPVSAKVEPSPSTPDKVVAMATQLFNQHGIQNVPMSRIASEVGISPGNLAYHFKTRREILVAMLPDIEHGMRDALQQPAGPLSPRQAAKWQIGIFAYLWRYRFFFNSLPHMLMDDEELQRRYVNFEIRIIKTLSTVLDAGVQQRLIRPVVEPNTTHLLATNMWMLWLAWLRTQQIRDPNSELVEHAAIYAGSLRHFSLMQSYYINDFGTQLLAAIAAALDIR